MYSCSLPVHLELSTLFNHKSAGVSYFKVIDLDLSREVMSRQKAGLLGIKLITQVWRAFFFGRSH